MRVLTLCLLAFQTVNSFTAISTARKNALVKNQILVDGDGPNISFNTCLFGSVSPTGTGTGINTSSSTNSKISLENIADKKILVVGGSGRVGGSVVCQLTRHGAKVTVGGTRSETFEESRARWKNLFPVVSNKFDSIPFAIVDRENDDSITSILQQAKEKGEGFDLVVHTAGPFQGKVKSPNGVIKSCVENSVAYLDVCDDYCTASAAKAKYTETALANGVPCILSTGCWVSFMHS